MIVASELDVARPATDRAPCRSPPWRRTGAAPRDLGRGRSAPRAPPAPARSGRGLAMSSRIGRESSRSTPSVRRGSSAGAASATASPGLWVIEPTYPSGSSGAPRGVASSGVPPGAQLRQRRAERHPTPDPGRAARRRQRRRVDGLLGVQPLGGISCPSAAPPRPARRTGEAGAARTPSPRVGCGGGRGDQPPDVGEELRAAERRDDVERQLGHEPARPARPRRRRARLSRRPLAARSRRSCAPARRRISICASPGACQRAGDGGETSSPAACRRSTWASHPSALVGEQLVVTGHLGRDRTRTRWRPAPAARSGSTARRSRAPSGRTSAPPPPRA